MSRADMLRAGGKAITAGVASALTAAALVLLLIMRPAEATCSNLQLKTKVTAKATNLAPGSPFLLTAYVVNKGSSVVNDLGVGLYLSNGLCRVKPSLKPNRKHLQNPTIVGNNLYWTGLSLKPGKRVRARLRGLINPQFTAPGEVSVGAVAYSASANCTVTAGPRTMTVQAAAKPLSKALAAAKIGQCGVNPVPDTNGAYSLYATGQRCAQAQLVPVGGRRQLEWGDMDAARRLQVTADSCWAACAAQGYSSPFYMNLNNAGGQTQCYCCQDCDLISDPNSTVYESAVEFCGLAACGSVPGRRVLDENGSVFVCTIPDIDMVQLQGSYPDAESCVSACMDEDPLYRFAAWSDLCSDACYCSIACTQAYGYFNEYGLYSLKEDPCPSIIPDDN